VLFTLGTMGTRMRSRSGARDDATTRGALGYGLEPDIDDAMCNRCADLIVNCSVLSTGPTITSPPQPSRFI
jgi:hypothetical protein